MALCKEGIHSSLPLKVKKRERKRERKTERKKERREKKSKSVSNIHGTGRGAQWPLKLKIGRYYHGVHGIYKMPVIPKGS